MGIAVYVDVEWVGEAARGDGEDSQVVAPAFPRTHSFETWDRLSGEDGERPLGLWIVVSQADELVVSLLVRGSVGAAGAGVEYLS
ncbi:MAG: hypothetical protein ACRDLT_12945 [Solirubrobacteraceae bacterium]